MLTMKFFKRALITGLLFTATLPPRASLGLHIESEAPAPEVPVQFVHPNAVMMEYLEADLKKLVSQYFIDRKAQEEMELVALNIVDIHFGQPHARESFLPQTADEFLRTKGADVMGHMRRFMASRTPYLDLKNGLYFSVGAFGMAWINHIARMYPSPTQSRWALPGTTPGVGAMVAMLPVVSCTLLPPLHRIRRCLSDDTYRSYPRQLQQGLERAHQTNSHMLNTCRIAVFLGVAILCNWYLPSNGEGDAKDATLYTMFLSEALDFFIYISTGYYLRLMLV